MSKEVGAEKAKILRARRRLDPQEQYDDEQFEEKFKEDPFAALSKIQEKQKKSERNIQRQVSYFGHVIEPFNMKAEKDIGTLDSDGFFVFNKKKGQVRDAWLDSLEIGNEEQLLQGIQKKILETNKVQPVNKESELTDEEDAQDNAQNSDDQEMEFAYEREKPAKKKKIDESNKIQAQKLPEMSPSQIKYLLSELLPDKTHCSNYLKQLKPVKKSVFKKNVRKSQMQTEATKADQTDLEEHQKILELCHLYIRQTGDHGIMTKTKEQLMKEIDIQQKRAAGVEPEKAKKDQEEEDKQEEKHDQKDKKETEKDEDDVF